jgi:hypothetical protein
VLFRVGSLKRRDELAACCGLGGDWDNRYIGVLAAIAAMRQ